MEYTRNPRANVRLVAPDLYRIERLTAGIEDDYRPESRRDEVVRIVSWIVIAILLASFWYVVGVGLGLMGR